MRDSGLQIHPSEHSRSAVHIFSFTLPCMTPSSWACKHPQTQGTTRVPSYQPMHPAQQRHPQTDQRPSSVLGSDRDPVLCQTNLSSCWEGALGLGGRVWVAWFSRLCHFQFLPLSFFFFNRRKLIVVLLLLPLIIPRSLSNGWLWNQFYTEFIPIRVMSGAMVSQNPEAGESRPRLCWLALLMCIVHSAM